MRPQFDATLLCEDGVSLGELVERGLGLLSSDCLDSDFHKSIHLGTLSPKSVTDGIKDGENLYFNSLWSTALTAISS